jgi:hypothetical protein
MSIPTAARDRIALRFQVLFPHLNERQRRLLTAAEARLVGHGGVRAVAQAAGVSETTVRKGVFELEQAADPLPAGRVRAFAPVKIKRGNMPLRKRSVATIATPRS